VRCRCRRDRLGERAVQPGREEPFPASDIGDVSVGALRQDPRHRRDRCGRDRIVEAGLQKSAPALQHGCAVARLSRLLREQEVEIAAARAIEGVSVRAGGRGSAERQYFAARRTRQHRRHHKSVVENATSPR
jgi:hypothetical protein